MNLKLRIMLRAIETRLANGEELEAVLASYPRLSDDEKAALREAVKEGRV